MEDADLFPSDFEVLLGSLTLLIYDERETETKISHNMREIEERFRAEVLPRHGIHIPPTTPSNELVISEKQIVGPPYQDQSQEQSQEQSQDQSQEQSQDQSQEQSQHSEESPEMSWTHDGPEPSMLIKKLFKRIAVQCHPDKVKDAKKNRFFLLGRKAYNENDIPTVLFILSKLACDISLEESELSEIRGFVETRRTAIHQKKDSFFYKWGFIGEDHKQHILNHIQILKSSST